jgi:hypothetical protein
LCISNFLNSLKAIIDRCFGNIALSSDLKNDKNNKLVCTSVVDDRLVDNAEKENNALLSLR